MSDQLANLLAKIFIARRDAKAIQHADGSWSPHTTTGRHDGERIRWRRSDLINHLEKKQTFGHYLLDTDSNCKLFAFDIDLEKNKPEINFQGSYVPNFGQEAYDPEVPPVFCDVREAWRDRAHPARPWLKYQLKMVAHKLMSVITSELEIPCAAAYSGAKGVHVYGFTGLIPAADAIEGAQLVMDTLGEFKASRGQNFFRHTNQDPVDGYPNITIEVFPKQASLEGKDLGNLMRLPLGKNQKSNDPTFFIDMTSATGQMIPIDPVFALTSPTPWRRPGE